MRDSAAGQDILLFYFIAWISLPERILVSYLQQLKYQLGMIPEIVRYWYIHSLLSFIAINLNRSQFYFHLFFKTSAIVRWWVVEDTDIFDMDIRDHISKYMHVSSSTH